MSAMAYLITSLTSVYSTVYSCAEQRKHQSSASLAFVWGIHRWPVNSPHKGPVTRKMFTFDDVMMKCSDLLSFQPRLFISHTHAFKAVTIYLHLKNARTDRCVASYLLLTQPQGENMASGKCQPFCSGLVHCQHIDISVSDLDIHTLRCQCPSVRCQDLALHVTVDAILDKTRPLKICHVGMYFER